MPSSSGAFRMFPREQTSFFKAEHGYALVPFPRPFVIMHVKTTGKGPECGKDETGCGQFVGR